MPPRRSLHEPPQQTLQELRMRFDEDISWIYGSCDPETQKMLFDTMDDLCRIVMKTTLAGTAPAGFRRVYDGVKRAISDSGLH